MEQRLDYTEQDAEAVLSKHQHKVTRHRVGVLLFLMCHRKAFTLRQLSEALQDTIDRVTVYRTLNAFLELNIIGKALNEKGSSCFFYLEHLKENKHTQTYLECEVCDQVFGLPAYPEQYRSVLENHQVKMVSTLSKGQCNRAECTSQPG